MRIVTILLILLLSSNSFAQEVSEQEITSLLNILAHPVLAGRGTGQPGFDLAGDIIAMKLRGYGMYPLPQLQNNYFHEFNFKQIIPSEESTLMILGIKSYEYEKDFLLVNPSASVIEGIVAFVGFGITAEEYQYDDYSNINIQGKIVVMFRHEPHESISDLEYFNGTEVTQHSYFPTKIDNAMKHGAVGMIIVEDILNHIGSYGPIDIRSNGPGVVDPLKERQPNTFPVLSVNLATANEILGVDIMDLQEEIEKEKRPRSFIRDNVTLRITTKEKIIDHKSRNVIGYFLGKERDEFILIGGHYDHLGVTEDGIYIGADDNASGTAGVLAVAQALSKGKRFRRSIIIALWGAEEWGLLGSQSFIYDQIIPLDQIKAVINLDMIGRNEKTHLNAIGAEDNLLFAEKSPKVFEILMEENSELEYPFDISFEDNKNLFYRTDSASFFLSSPEEKRIPTLFLTSGDHVDYHRPTDTSEKLDRQKISNISRLAYQILIKLANDKELPKYN